MVWLAHNEDHQLIDTPNSFNLYISSKLNSLDVLESESESFLPLLLALPLADFCEAADLVPVAMLRPVSSASDSWNEEAWYWAYRAIVVDVRVLSCLHVLLPTSKQILHYQSYNFVKR